MHFTCSKVLFKFAAKRMSGLIAFSVGSEMMLFLTTFVYNFPSVCVHCASYVLVCFNSESLVVASGAGSTHTQQPDVICFILRLLHICRLEPRSSHTCCRMCTKHMHLTIHKIALDLCIPSKPKYTKHTHVQTEPARAARRRSKGPLPLYAFDKTI